MNYKTTRFLFVLLFTLFSYEWSFAQVDSLLFKDLTYRNVGPARGGRATAVAGIASLPATYYMGTTGGGLWKTNDYGNNWFNVSDGYFTTPSIGAISVFQNDPNIVYVGTGSDGLRSNVITGKGMYKSTDAGKTWQFIGLRNSGHIGAVEIHPENPNVVFVAAIGQAFGPNEERGIFKTEDGGKTWEKVLFISNKTGFADLEFAPNNADIVYAAAWEAERKPWTILSGGTEGGIFKSTDGGKTWNKLEGGLPQGIIGKIDLAVSAANPNRLWALVEAPEDKKLGGVYRSDDQGESFTLVSTKKELLDRPFYYCNIDCNPQNADDLYVSATRFFRSPDGGQNWIQMATPHGDNHGIWMNPNDALLFAQVNDGGGNITRDGGKTWSTQFNQPTAELYQVEVDDQFPYWLYAGQQDNYTTVSVPSLPPYGVQAGPNSYITNTGGCETGPAVPKPGNPDIVYSNCKGRFGVYNKKTGQDMQYYVGASNMYGHNPKDLKFRFQRVSPIHVSPHNSDVVYHTSQYVHKTMDDGKTWEIISPDLTAFTEETQVISGSPITRDITGEEFYSTIYAIRESKVEEGVIWTGANDGPIYVTKDGGKNWENVTPVDLPKGGRVETIEPSPHKKGKAYAAVYRYLLGDWKPYIYKTEDYGKSWKNLTSGANGIPNDVPTRVIREDVNQEGLLYAGTDIGMFISFDDGKNWQSFQQNLPLTPITDIKLHHNDLVLSTMGRSFWILDNLGTINQISGEIATKKVHLFEPADAYRMRYRSTSPNYVPYYPTASAAIDYYIGEEINSEIKLEILNADKAVIRTFSSLAKLADDRSKERDMSTEFTAAGNDSQLLTSKGMHRFQWDMRHVGAWNENARRSGLGGPMVAPDTYQVRLTVDGEVMTQDLKILMDERMKNADVQPSDLKAQETLSIQIKDLQTQAHQMVYSIKSRRKTIAKTKKEEGKLSKAMEKEDRQLEVLEKALVTEEGRYMQPMIVAQIRYLASMLKRADQMPGKDAYERYTDLKKQVEALTPDWENVLKKEMKN